MGGRGASSGISAKGRAYGTEYRTLMTAGNVKFIAKNGGAASAPLETMTRGRVYATVNDKQEISTISYYDSKGKKFKTIDLLHSHKEISGEHTHKGYYHDEKGTHEMTARERAMVARAREKWYNHRSGKP